MATQAVDILIKARDQASAKFGAVGRSASAMSGVLRNAAMAVGGFLSARAILTFAQSSVQAFAEEQKAVNQLGSALDLLGKKSDLSGMLTFAAEIQSVTTVADDAAINLMKFGASIGGLSGDTLKQATVAAIGLSKAYGMDLEAAMMLVSKAAAGNTAAMGRYGIVFKDGMTDAEKFNQVLEIGKQKFAMAEAETQTFSGKLAQLANAWGDAKESMGQYITNIPLVTEGMDAAIMSMQNFGMSVGIVWDTIKLNFLTVWDSWKNTMTNVGRFFYNWKTWLLNLGELIKEILMANFRHIAAGFKTVWEFLKNPTKGIDFSILFDAFKTTGEKIRKELNFFEGMDFGPQSDSAKALEKSIEERIRLAYEQQLKQGKTLDTSNLGAAQLVTAAGGAAKENKVGAVESRFLTGQTGSAENYARKTSENTQRQTTILTQILKATQELKQGNPQTGGMLAANLI